LVGKQGILRVFPGKRGVRPHIFKQVVLVIFKMEEISQQQIDQWILQMDQEESDPVDILEAPTEEEERNLPEFLFEVDSEGIIIL